MLWILQASGFAVDSVETIFGQGLLRLGHMQGQQMLPAPDACAYTCTTLDRIALASKSFKLTLIFYIAGKYTALTLTNIADAIQHNMSDNSSRFSTPETQGVIGLFQ